MKNCYFKPNIFNLLGLALAFLFLVTLSKPLAAEEVKIKILAINPSPNDMLKTSISHDLPPELKPEDIVDPAGMEIRFDKEHKVYMLEKEVELAPKEVRTMIVTVKNVWKVPEELFSEIEEELEKNVIALQGTKYEEISRMLHSKIQEKIGQIQEEQDRAIGIRQRIQLYRAHMKQLDVIRKKIASIGSLRKFEEEQEEGIRTVRFVIHAENPSNQAQVMRVKAYLPKDIVGTDVLEKGNFNLLYDAQQDRFFLEKEEEFAPKEKKSFEVILRDIWFIPISELDFLKDQTDKLLEHFSGSSYEAFARQSGEYIYTTLESIERLQNEVAGSEAIEDRIRAFILNSERMEVVKKKIKELQDLLLEVPLKRQLSEFEKIRQAIKELSKVIDILRLGFTPDLSTTWWIILGIIAFLFVLSAVFYVVWLVKLTENQFGKKAAQKVKKVAVKPAAQAPPVAQEQKAQAA